MRRGWTEKKTAGGEEMGGLAGRASGSGGHDLNAVAVCGIDGAEAMPAGVAQPSDAARPSEAQDSSAQDSSVSRRRGACAQVVTMIFSIFSSDGAIPDEERWSPTTLEICILSIIGLMTGVGSVLTGTGGPLIYLPIVLTWKAKSVSPKSIIGASAVLSTCLVVAAIVSLVVSAELQPDWGLCIIIMVSSLIGVTVGVRILQLVSRDKLQLAMAVILVGVGVVTLYQGAASPPAARAPGGDNRNRRRLQRLPTSAF
jgi:hypothetical protein